MVSGSGISKYGTNIYAVKMFLGGAGWTAVDSVDATSTLYLGNHNVLLASL